MHSEYGSVCFLFNSLNIEDPAMVLTHLVWDLLTPRGAASFWERTSISQ